MEEKIKQRHDEAQIDHLLGKTSTSLQLSLKPLKQYLPELPTQEYRASLWKNQEMRIQKSALRVISTNELAFMAMENVRLRFSFAFCCPMNIFI